MANSIGAVSSDGGVLALREAGDVSGSPIGWPPAWWTGARRIRSRTSFRHHSFSTADDRRRLRGRQRRLAPARRSAVQDGDEFDAVRSPASLAVDDLAAGEPARDSGALRMGRAMVDLYCASFREVPKRITLDIDDTFDAVHGGQQLRLFERPLRRLWVSADGRVRRGGPFCRGHAASGQAAERQGGPSVPAPAVRAVRANWPRTEILARAPTVTTAVPRFSTVSGQPPRLRSRRRPRPCADTSKPSRPAPRRASRPPRERARSAASRSSSTPPRAGAASSGSSLASRRARKAPIRATSSPISPDATLAPSMRTSIAARPSGKPHQVLQDASGGGSHVMHQASANQLRLFLHAGAYCRCGVGAVRCPNARCGASRNSTPCACAWSNRARVVEMKTTIRVHLPTSCPGQEVWASPSRKSRASSPEPRGIRPKNRTPPFNPQTPSLPAPASSRIRPVSSATMSKHDKSPFATHQATRCSRRCIVRDRIHRESPSSGRRSRPLRAHGWSSGRPSVGPRACGS